VPLAKIPLGQRQCLTGDSLGLGVLAVLEEANRGLVESDDQILCGRFFVSLPEECLEHIPGQRADGLQGPSRVGCGQQYECQAGDSESGLHCRGSSPFPQLVRFVPHHTLCYSGMRRQPLPWYRPEPMVPGVTVVPRANSTGLTGFSG